jgi:ketosteroid isomerase-like protein
MNARIRHAVLAWAALILLAPALGAHEGSDADDVKQIIDTFLTTMSGADATRLGEMFADDATVFYPSLPFPMHRIVGRSDIEAAWRAGFSSIPNRGAAPARRIQPKRVQIQTYGDTAIVTFELDGGPPRVGRRTFVLVRQRAAWKIAHLHASNRTE